MFKRLNKKNLKTNSGQSLIEVIIAVVIGAILVGASAITISPILRSNLETRNVGIATSFAQEYLDNIQSLTESGWQVIYNPPSAKGPSSQFYLVPSGTTYAVRAGTTSTIFEGKTFTRYFSIENVNRDSCGVGNITNDNITSCSLGPSSIGVADDPSTQEITVTVTWPVSGSLTRTQYFTRNINKTFVQIDWSGGSGQEGPITVENNKFTSSVNINSTSSPGSIKLEGF